MIHTPLLHHYKNESSYPTFSGNQSAKSSKPPNGLNSGDTLPDTLPQGPDNSLFLAKSKVTRHGVAFDTWLPAGWLIEDRVRSSGAGPGLVNKVKSILSLVTHMAHVKAFNRPLRRTRCIVESGE